MSPTIERSLSVLRSSSRPLAAAVRNAPTGVIASWGALLAVFLWSYSWSLNHLAYRWANEADYSHGFFVPVFAGFLLWWRREMICPFPASGSWWGLAFLLLSGAMRWASLYYHYVLMEPASLLPCLVGVVLLLGGRPALRWSWPAIAFLVFMIPLPGFVAGQLSHPLQRVATLASTYSLQTVGVPAVAQGNVIWLSNGKIGVVEACSGLRMLMLFFAITVGASFLVRRPLWEKAFIASSAVAIAVIANVFRITVTGLLHEVAGAELAEVVFHDLAGWLMMPVATVLLWIEIHLLSKLLVPARPSGPLAME